MKPDQPKTETSAPVSSTPLLGAFVEISMIGYEGRWLVVRDDGGAKVWVQRPQDFKPKWVMRRYIKAPNH